MSADLSDDQVASSTAFPVGRRASGIEVHAVATDVEFDADLDDMNPNRRALQQARHARPD